MFLTCLVYKRLMLSVFLKILLYEYGMQFFIFVNLFHIYIGCVTCTLNFRNKITLFHNYIHVFVLKVGKHTHCIKTTLVSVCFRIHCVLVRCRKYVYISLFNQITNLHTQRIHPFWCRFIAMFKKQHHHFAFKICITYLHIYVLTNCPKTIKIR